MIRGPLEHVNAAHLEAVVRDELDGTFFTMNLDSARASLAKVPWVRSVALRRQWPQRLEVTIEEHVPFARWNDAALVDTFGDVFVAEYEGELPQFAGPDGRAAEVARALSRIERGAGAARAHRESRSGCRRGAAGASRRKGDRGSIAIELGRDDPVARLTRFVAVYERTIGALARAGTRIDHVDLRYRNGFAARVPGFRERAQKKAAA